MRILIHDFAGHPFQVQLSRELASRGHHVTHAYPLGLQGPKGRLTKSEGDSEYLSLNGISLSGSFRKYSPWRRFITQRKYARDLKQLIARERIEVVLSGNTPIDVQAELLWFCRLRKIGFVHWVQDVYCQAIEFFLRRKFAALARPASYPFRRLEMAVARHSRSNVAIAPAFETLLRNWGVPESRITVLENWAPLEEMSVQPRDNAWSREFGLNQHTVFLYSGTLGMKHRPDLIYRLAQLLDECCKVVVITEGVGREYLEAQPPLNNLLVLGFQPYHRLPEVLGSADVLLATLESGAGEFAVPSKILTYLCAGRPILLAAPRTNLAASVIERSGGGLAVDPDESTAWGEAAKLLAGNAALRSSLGRKGRAYAEFSFDIARITDAFEEILTRAAARHPVAMKPRVPASTPAEFSE